jgi:hypothetical protein
MILSFYANSDTLVAIPGQQRVGGSKADPYVTGPPKKYVARDLIPAKNPRQKGRKIIVDEPAKYVCSQKPFSCEANSTVGRFLVRQMRNRRCRRKGVYPLWPADKETAEFLSIPFVAVKVVDGETVPIKQNEKASAGAKGG